MTAPDLPVLATGTQTLTEYVRWQILDIEDPAEATAAIHELHLELIELQVRLTRPVAAGG